MPDKNSAQHRRLEHGHVNERSQSMILPRCDEMLLLGRLGSLNTQVLRHCFKVLV